jgi:NADPH:quinone reductase-like Zn-dependent oxidoreductase
MAAMRATSPEPASLAREIVPVPDPGPDELLVEVRATAITADGLTWPEDWPAIPCRGLSGVVAALGGGVTSWQPGDEVYGLVGFDRPGAAAGYVTVPAVDLACKPERIDHLAAAAVPLGGLTAWQALHEHAQVQPGQHVLVRGGAGGVGAYAVQLAALAGARVTATASARNREFVAGLGASDVLDCTGRFEDHAPGVDVIIDAVGGDTMARSWPLLRSGGILAAIAEEPDEDRAGRDDVRGMYFVVRPDGGQLRELAALIGKQQLRPAVSMVFELNDLPEAFRAQRGQRPPGKVIISVGHAARRMKTVRVAPDYGWVHDASGADWEERSALCGSRRSAANRRKRSLPSSSIACSCASSTVTAARPVPGGCWPTPRLRLCRRPSPSIQTARGTGWAKRASGSSSSCPPGKEDHLVRQPRYPEPVSQARFPAGEHGDGDLARPGQPPSDPVGQRQRQAHRERRGGGRY